MSATLPARPPMRLALGDLAALGFIGLVVVLILFGPAIAPFSPTEFHSDNALQPPGMTFLFGTDEFGRDVFSRVLCGARPTLLLALAAATTGVALGTLTGLIAGYAGGVLDEVLMRFMDALMSFPALILAMLVVVMLGGNAVNVVVALGVVFWPRSARLVRSVVVEVAQREFIDAAHSRGEAWPYILAREILPNVRMIIVVDFSLRITYGILLSASLAYLGIGVAPPTPAWGLMVRDGQQFLELAPWLVIFPCLAVALTAVSTLLLGERVRRTVALPGGARPR
ncbi:MAG: ABC transporter permease [Acetobacteraceae bacterium]